MIEFTDSFSQAAVAQALCTHPDLDAQPPAGSA